MSEVKEFKPREGNTARKVSQDTAPARTPVQKTYKLFINGEFPRTESGRYLEVKAADGTFLGNSCRASRKDVRNAVLAARGAFSTWSARSAYNRGQILYRIGEFLEDRRAQFEAELVKTGSSAADATHELDQSIDRLVHYAGWSDKFQQLASTVNPVASSHFVFSAPEPTGVITALVDAPKSLLALVSAVAPAIVAGNTIVALAAESNPFVAVTFAEALHASDVPAGVVNILTGLHEELMPHLSTHMDVNAVIGIGLSDTQNISIRENAAINVKRTIVHDAGWLDSEDAESPYPIIELTENKTTWHPIGK